MADVKWEFPTYAHVVAHLTPEEADKYSDSRYSMAVVEDTWLVVYEVQPSRSVTVHRAVPLVGNLELDDLELLQRFVQQEARIFNVPVQA